MRIIVANSKVRSYRRMVRITGFLTVLPWGQMASAAPVRLKNATVIVA